MEYNFDRCTAVIDLNAIAANYINYTQTTNSKIMAVVKADAYGHGAIEVAKQLNKCGCDNFAVASVVEAVKLRQSGVSGQILILGRTPIKYVNEVVAYDLTVSINDYLYAIELNNTAVKPKVKCHIKLNTGMNRLGLPTKDYLKAADTIEDICRLSNINCVGIYTHFACADNTQGNFTELQYDKFLQTINELNQRNIYFEQIHCNNSLGGLNYNRYTNSFIRLGGLLYGLNSSGIDCGVKVRYAMSLFAKIIQINKIQKGDYVGYSKGFETRQNMTIATVSIGYADGYARRLSNRGIMQVGDRVASVVGNVCMDMTMIDVTDIAVEEGQCAMAFGNGIANVDNIAKLLQTINYEVTCNISSRVDKIYIKTH